MLDLEEFTEASKPIRTPRAGAAAAGSVAHALNAHTGAALSLVDKDANESQFNSRADLEALDAWALRLRDHASLSLKGAVALCLIEC